MTRRPVGLTHKVKGGRTARCTCLSGIWPAFHVFHCELGTVSYESMDLPSGVLILLGDQEVHYTRAWDFLLGGLVRGSEFR